MSDKRSTEYSCSYSFYGKQYAFRVDAKNEQEALQRMKAIAATGKVDGEFVEEGNIFSFLGAATIIQMFIYFVIWPFFRRKK